MPPPTVLACCSTHSRRLYRLARRIAKDGEEARDLVQETFLRAARSPRSIPYGTTPEEAWLVRVLVNLCRDRWRRAAPRQRFERKGTPRQDGGRRDV